MSTRKRLSVFDVIGPVMIGPSSSHTAGTARLGKLARSLLGQAPQRAVFTLYGSLAATYRGHGSDVALIGGVLGLEPDDEQLRHAQQLADQQGLQVSFLLEHDETALLHPNMVRIKLTAEDNEVEIVGASIGGGKVEILELNGFSVSLKGEEYTVVINSWDRPGVITSLTRILGQADANIGNMAVSRRGRGQEVVMAIELDSSLSEQLIESLRQVSGVIRVTILRRI